MQFDKYELMPGQEEHEYEFYSEGPNGKIKKRVVFHKPTDSAYPVYNLSFGDWNERLDVIDLRAVSNNRDRQKILATVAEAVVPFTKKNPDAIIFATGSTPSRTRLYQMGIATYWNEISSLFNIGGNIGKTWEPFRKGINYSGFLLQRKKL